MEALPPPPKEEWSFLLGFEIGDEGDGDEDESLLAAAAASGVPYFLGLPRFLRTVSNGDDTADGTGLGYTM